MVFPSLRKEYMPFLEHISGQIGLVGRPGEEKWLRRNESLLHLPLVKVLMKSIDQLPQVAIAYIWGKENGIEN